MATKLKRHYRMSWHPKHYAVICRGRRIVGKTETFKFGDKLVAKLNQMEAIK